MNGLDKRFPRRRRQKKSTPKRTIPDSIYFHNLVDDIAPKLRLRKIARTKNYDELDWPPIYRLKISAFKRLLLDYEQHVKWFERYYLKGRSSKTIISEINRVGFKKRYGNVMSNFVCMCQIGGRMIPFLNPMYFKGKVARSLFWKLGDLEDRMWHVKFLPDRGGRPLGPDAITAKFHRLAIQQYRNEFRSNRYETHPGLCRDVHQKLRSLEIDGTIWTISQRSLENLLLPVRRSLLKKQLTA